MSPAVTVGIVAGLFVLFLLVIGLVLILFKLNTKKRADPPVREVASRIESARSITLPGLMEDEWEVRERRARRAKIDASVDKLFADLPSAPPTITPPATTVNVLRP